MTFEKYWPIFFQMLLPYEIIRHIRSYMLWKHKTLLINKQWLYEVFRQKYHIRKWSSKIRVYSYMKMFGPVFVNYSWESFARLVCGCKRRHRNAQYRLSWRAAVKQVLCRNKCRSCGRQTYTNVFGIHLCLNCRKSPHKKYAYMVNIREALSMGISRKALNEIPFHNAGMYGKYRFYYIIRHKIHYNF